MPTHLNALPDGYKLHEYELVRVLGSGGFGIAYLGHDHSLNRPVAIKEYLPNDLARFDHRNLVKVHRFFEALRVATDAQSIGLGLNKSSQVQRCNRSCDG